MNWFRRDNLDKREVRSKEKEEAAVSSRVSLPTSHSSFNYFFLLFFAFSVAIVLMKTGSLQAVSQNAVQTNGAVGIAALFAFAVRGIMGRLVSVGVAMFKIKKAQYEQNGKTEKNHHNHGQLPHSFGWIRILNMTRIKNPAPRIIRQLCGKSLKNWLTKPTVKMAFARSPRNFAINSLIRSPFTYKTISWESLRCQGQVQII